MEVKYFEALMGCKQIKKNIVDLYVNIKSRVDS